MATNLPVFSVILMVLRLYRHDQNLVASNAGNLRAYEYLLCYHLLSKDLRSFVEDYVPGKVSSPIFAEALLIHLARQGNIRAEELIKYQSR